MEEIPSVPLTRPAGAGHPLPSGEGFSRMHFPFWTAQPGQEGQLLNCFIRPVCYCPEGRGCRPSLDARRGRSIPRFNV